MAKGNMLLGQAVGSVGDITFSRVNGKQVIKAKPSTVKNPQTESQLIQRILMNTIIQAYSKMSEITDHSFEGVTAGQDSMSYFMARNLKMIRYQLSVTNDMSAVPPYVCPLGVNGLATNDYIVAKGSLPEITPTVSSGGVALGIEANTYGAIIAACNAKRGDQITIITVNGNDVANQKFVFSRIILDPLDSTGEELPLTTPFIVNNAINAAHPRNENNGHTYAFDNGEFVIAPFGDVTNMGCIIASRQASAGAWLRSNATMLQADEEGQGYSMDQALAMFYAGGIDVENPRYLNNAARARRIVTTPSDNGGGTDSGNGGGGSDQPQAPAAPVIAATTGSEFPLTVTITGAAGAEIHYTTDGSEPTAASTTYSNSFTVNAQTTVKAIAIKDGLTSAVSTKVVNISEGGDEMDQN